MARLDLQWSAVHWQGGQPLDAWVVVRLEWSPRPEATRGAELLFARIAIPDVAERREGPRALVVSGRDGFECPPLPEGRLALPGAALGAPLYLLFPAAAAPAEPFFVQVVLVLEAEGDDEVEEVEVDLSGAWPRPPSAWLPDLATVTRLLDGGGREGERAAYCRLLVSALARIEHPTVAALRLSLEAPEAAAALPLDMRALARPGAILELARVADVGDLEAVRRGVQALPEPLREAPNVLSLLRVAEAASRIPGMPDRRALMEAERARAEGQFGRAIEACEQVVAGSELYSSARTARLHVVADAIEDAIRRRELGEARQWLDRERATLEREVGADDPWLVSVLRVLDPASAPMDADELGASDDLEFGDAELARPIDRIHQAGRAVWARVRGWIDAQLQ